MCEVLIDIFIYRDPQPSPNGKRYPFRVEANAGTMCVCPPFYEETEEKLTARGVDSGEVWEGW